jgi:NAD(P)-dependent dehydrogenase (short-subunit alcohol dehydrogenase family)
MDLKLKGKKAIVTGGSAGIGLAVARLLAEEGVEVADRVGGSVLDAGYGTGEIALYFAE